MAAVVCLLAYPDTILRTLLAMVTSILRASSVHGGRHCGPTSYVLKAVSDLHRNRDNLRNPAPRRATCKPRAIILLVVYLDSIHRLPWRAALCLVAWEDPVHRLEHVGHCYSLYSSWVVPKSIARVM